VTNVLPVTRQRATILGPLASNFARFLLEESLMGDDDEVGHGSYQKLEEFYGCWLGELNSYDVSTTQKL